VEALAGVVMVEALAGVVMVEALAGACTAALHSWEQHATGWPAVRLSLGQSVAGSCRAGRRLAWPAWHLISALQCVPPAAASAGRPATSLVHACHLALVHLTDRREPPLKYGLAQPRTGPSHTSHTSHTPHTPLKSHLARTPLTPPPAACRPLCSRPGHPEPPQHHRALRHLRCQPVAPQASARQLAASGPLPGRYLRDWPRRHWCCCGGKLHGCCAL
jgi:hypothetical protein